MTTPRRFRTDAFAAVHSAARDLRRAGLIDKATMRDFDVSCLTPVPAMAPADIKRIRERACVSQLVFARYLNTSPSTVQKWETGAKRPSGMALKLLSVVDRHGLQVLG
jgi:putative transcriptional regulator